MVTFSHSKRLMVFAILFGLLSALTLTIAKTHADESVPTYTYQISIHTCDIGGAGTDGDVSVQLLADRWATQWATLDKSWYNDFERNDRDTYSMRVATNRPLSQRLYPEIKVRLDPSGLGAEWCMDQLKVREVETNTYWSAYPVTALGDWFGASKYCKGIKSYITCERERTWHLLPYSSGVKSKPITPTATPPTRISSPKV